MSFFTSIYSIIIFFSSWPYSNLFKNMQRYLKVSLFFINQLPINSWRNNQRFWLYFHLHCGIHKWSGKNYRERKTVSIWHGSIPNWLIQSCIQISPFVRSISTLSMRSFRTLHWIANSFAFPTAFDLCPADETWKQNVKRKGEHNSVSAYE